MIATFILHIVLMFGSGQGTSSTAITAEYHSQSSCESARQWIERNKSNEARVVVSGCFKK